MIKLNRLKVNLFFIRYLCATLLIYFFCLIGINIGGECCMENIRQIGRSLAKSRILNKYLSQDDVYIKEESLEKKRKKLYNGFYKNFSKDYKDGCRKFDDEIWEKIKNNDGINEESPVKKLYNVFFFNEYLYEKLRNIRLNLYDKILIEYNKIFDININKFPKGDIYKDLLDYFFIYLIHNNFYIQKSKKEFQKKLKNYKIKKVGEGFHGIGYLCKKGNKKLFYKQVRKSIKELIGIIWEYKAYVQILDKVKKNENNEYDKYKFYFDEKYVYFFSPFYANSKSLFDLLGNEKFKNLEKEKKEKICFNILQKWLDLVENKKLSHGDLQPQNILLQNLNKNEYKISECDKYQVCLLDFGTSLCLDKDNAFWKAKQPLNEAYNIYPLFAYGTRAYLPYEVVINKIKLEKDGFISMFMPVMSDIYSLGILFYEIMTGDNPYKATLESSVEKNIINHPEAIYDRISKANIRNKIFKDLFLQMVRPLFIKKSKNECPWDTSILGEYLKNFILRNIQSVENYNGNNDIQERIDIAEIKESEWYNNMIKKIQENK